MSNSYLFQSKRLGFRPLQATDLDVMAAINSDADVMRFFPRIQNREQTKGFIQRMINQQLQHGYSYYATETLAAQDFIGFIGLSKVEIDIGIGTFTDIGWRLSPKHWAKGYATEGATQCIRYGIEELGLSRIYAMAPCINLPSIRVMHKCGMSFQKTFEHPLLLKDNRLRDGVLYSITAKTMGQ